MLVRNVSVSTPEPERYGKTKKPKNVWRGQRVTELWVYMEHAESIHHCRPSNMQDEQFSEQRRSHEAGEETDSLMRTRGGTSPHHSGRW